MHEQIEQKRLRGLHPKPPRHAFKVLPGELTQEPR